MRITFITGYPGAGKTTYAEGTGRVTYDMDLLADALDYGRNTREARDVADKLLIGFISAAAAAGVEHINVIRTTPSTAEMMQRHVTEFVEIQRSIEECKACRPTITPESWNGIILIHENWLKNNRHKTISIPAERW